MKIQTKILLLKMFDNENSNPIETSVSSEAWFSQVGLIQTEIRNRIPPNLLDC